MTDATTDSAWAYQGSADIAERVEEKVGNLRDGIEDELGPEALTEQIEGIEKDLEELRNELNEMPGY